MESKLSGVPETMLIPLRARYLETKKESGIIKDPMSVEILEKIDYDFCKNKEVSKGSQIGVAIRTEILDEQTVLFLNRFPDALVINLGCGLDTRFHRLETDQVTWFDLDVPEAINLRKLFFKETDKYKFIPKSVLDFSWIKQIPKNRHVLFLAEGLLMYLKEDEVKSILKTINENFPGSQMLFEAMSPFIVKRSDKHPDVKKYDATFKWGIKSGKEIEKWDIGVKFISEYFYFDRHKNKHPLIFKLLSIIPAFKKGMKIIHIGFSNNPK